MIRAYIIGPSGEEPVSLTEAREFWLRLHWMARKGQVERVYRVATTLGWTARMHYTGSKDLVVSK